MLKFTKQDNSRARAITNHVVKDYQDHVAGFGPIDISVIIEDHVEGMGPTVRELVYDMVNGRIEDAIFGDAPY